MDQSALGKKTYKKCNQTKFTVTKDEQCKFSSLEDNLVLSPLAKNYQLRIFFIIQCILSHLLLN